MQVPRQKNNVFGIRHYIREHSNGNDKNGHYPDLASPQKHKRPAETVGIYKFLPNMIQKYAEWISSMINFLQKNKQFEWGPDQVLGLLKLKKHFTTNKPLIMHDPKKQIKLQTDISDKTIKVMVF